MNFASLFSGIGGFDLGFERAGMTCTAQVEIDKQARSVLRRHFPTAQLLADITSVSGGDLGSAVDVLCGGFPCQDVSLAGRRAGLAGERSGLWYQFHRLIFEVQPQFVVIENVPGLLSSNQGRDMLAVLQGLADIGYLPAWRVLDSQYFGVAQRRRRVFIVASLGDGRAAQVLFERESGGGHSATAGKARGFYTTSNQHAEGPYWDGSDVTDTIDTVIAKRQTMPEKRRFQAVVVPAWRQCPDCDDVWCDIHGMHAYDCDCPDIDTWAEHDLFPYVESAVRFLTPTECERLQGFPDGWTAGQSDSARYRQLGNAVTVNVAEWIGRRLMEVAR